MVKQIINLRIILICITSFSQSNFEKGYFINETNEKVACLIDNQKWNYNPKEFKYKLSENATIQTSNFATISEFKIGNYKFIRFLDGNENKYLRCLIEGSSSLFNYKDIESEHFYFSSKGMPLSKLSPINNDLKNENSIEKHFNFKQQIWDNVRCGPTTIIEINDLDYDASILVKYFVNNNKCNDSWYYNYFRKDRKGQFNLKIKGGLNLTSISIPSLDNPKENFVDFGSNIGYRIGTELEFILPINNYKWAIFLEPTFSSITSESKTLNTNVEQVELKYNTIEFPLGIRYYIHLNPNTKLFLSASYLINQNIDSSVNFENSEDLQFSKITDWTFGFGFNIKNKYGLECRYHKSNDNLFKETYYQSEYDNISVSFIYTILEK